MELQRPLFVRCEQFFSFCFVSTAKKLCTLLILLDKVGKIKYNKYVYKALNRNYLSKEIDHMKKILTRCLILILALSMLTMFVACTKDETTDNGDGGTTSTQAGGPTNPNEDGINGGQNNGGNNPEGDLDEADDKSDPAASDIF